MNYSGLSVIQDFCAVNAFRDTLEYLARRVKMELWDQRYTLKQLIVLFQNNVFCFFFQLFFLHL